MNFIMNTICCYICEIIDHKLCIQFMGLCDNWSDIVVLVLTTAIFKNGGFEHWRWNIKYFKLFPFPPFYNDDFSDNSYYHKMWKLDLMAILKSMAVIS